MSKQDKERLLSEAASVLGKRRAAVPDWSEHCRMAAQARAQKLSADRRSEIARLAGLASGKARGKKGGKA